MVKRRAKFQQALAGLPVRQGLQRCHEALNVGFEIGTFVGVARNVKAQELFQALRASQRFELCSVPRRDNLDLHRSALLCRHRRQAALQKWERLRCAALRQ